MGKLKNNIKKGKQFKNNSKTIQKQFKNNSKTIQKQFKMK